MRIERIDLIKVVVPANDDAVNSAGVGGGLHKLPNGLREAWSLQFDEIAKHILVATCEDGTVGYGESLRGARDDILVEMARRLIGVEVTRLLWGRLPFPAIREYDAVETLALDLIGKAHGVPAHQLLGGAVRDRVRVGGWSGHRTSEDAARHAASMSEEGLTCLKLKCSLDDDLVGLAEAVADGSAGRMGLILDPNERLEELRFAISLARRLERVGNVVCIEDPLPRWDLTTYETLRSRTDIPICVHVAFGYTELGQRLEDVASAFRHRAADMFNLSAGVAVFGRMAAFADIAHLPYWHGSEIDLGIMEAAMVHAAAAAPGCILPSDIFGRRIREHDLLATPLTFDADAVVVPEAAGLGVVIDDDAIERYEQSRERIER